MTPDQHALLMAAKELSKGSKLFRPSSISRTLKCPGSVLLALRAGRPNRSSPAAREGTAAHLIAASALMDERQPEEWVDRAVKLDDGGADIYVNQEMADGVQMYVDEISKRWRPGVEKHVEHHMTLSALDPADPLLAENAGTGDCVLLDRANGRITIADLKYGKGVMIAGDSPQLKDYGLLALLSFPNPGGWRELETLVVQPRAANPAQRIKSVLHDPGLLLMDFLSELVTIMTTALDPNAPVVAGSHCQWCDGAALCPALQHEAQEIARAKFAASPMVTVSTERTPLPAQVAIGTMEEPRPAKTVNNTVLPSPMVMSPEEIATVLQREPLWDMWMTSVKHRAVLLLESGAEIPGYMLTRRSGNRKFIDTAEAWTSNDVVPEAFRNLGVSPCMPLESVLQRLGLGHDDLYAEPKLLSPAQLEKKLPAVRRALMTALVERPLGAPTLVECTDKRQPEAPKLGALPVHEA